MLSTRRSAQLGILAAAIVLVSSMVLLVGGRESLKPQAGLPAVEMLSHRPVGSAVVLGGAGPRYTP